MPSKIMVGMMETNYASLSNGLLAWWPMNEGGTGKVCHDNSSNGNDLTFQGSAPFSGSSYFTGYGYGNQYCAGLRRGNSNYLTLKNTLSLTSGPHSYCAWVRLLETGTNSDAVFGNHASGADTNFYGNGYRYYAPGDLVVAATGATIGLWMHWAFTITNSGTSYLYLNGVQNASGGSTGATFTLGAIGSGNTVSCLQGDLQNVRVYSRLLSATEAKWLYTGGL